MRVTIKFTIPCEIDTSELLNHMLMDRALTLIEQTAHTMLEESAKPDSYFDDMKLHHIIMLDDDPEEPIGEWLIEPNV